MLYYKNKTIKNISELLNCYSTSEFKSPYRSTIPLISLFMQNRNFINEIDPNIEPTKCDFTFEFITKLNQGKGNSSFTDLMILDGKNSIAIEAKRTEPKYNTVEKWIGENPENRKIVIESWLKLINKTITPKISTNDIKNLPYQMIHRLASACSQEKENIYLVYFGFDLKPKMKEYYIQNLKVLSELLQKKVTVKLICFEIEKKEKQKRLESLWSKGDRNFTNEIKKSIVENNLMTIKLV